MDFFNQDFSYLLKIGIALLAIVNPIGSLPIFISATNGWNKADRAKAAQTVGLTVFIVLSLAAFIGDATLNFFGISIPSFQVGGGILLMLISISMMHGKHNTTSQTVADAQHLIERDVIAIVPLSIPLLAGPGAISSMILSAQQHPTFLGHISLVIPVFLVSVVIWLVLKLSDGITKQLGAVGIIIITRLMGLILAAMAVEFIAHGLTGLFPQLVSA